VADPWSHLHTLSAQEAGSTRWELGARARGRAPLTRRVFSAVDNLSLWREA
jgi:hypothetical protein